LLLGSWGASPNQTLPSPSPPPTTTTTTSATLRPPIHLQHYLRGSVTLQDLAYLFL
jgi:hypothetical protein